MSRSITIQVTFMNGKTSSRGAHNARYAEYAESRITEKDLTVAFHDIITHVENRKVKGVKVIHRIGSSKGAVEKVTHEYPSLAHVSPAKIVRMNIHLYHPTVTTDKKRRS